MSDDEKNGNGIARSAAIPPRRDPIRRVRIAWHGDRPMVEELTGADAKRALASTLLEVRRLQGHVAGLNRLRESLSQAVVAFVHREAVRGLVDASGAPVLPMSSVLPAASIAVAAERWTFQISTQPDGNAVVVVERGPEPDAGPKVIT